VIEVSLGIVRASIGYAELAKIVGNARSGARLLLLRLADCGPIVAAALPQIVHLGIVRAVEGVEFRDRLGAGIAGTRRAWARQGGSYKEQKLNDLSPIRTHATLGYDWPPSTTSTAPVVKLAAGLAKYSAAPTISSGSPARPPA